MTHIIGKVYDLTQENFNKVLRELEQLQEMSRKWCNTIQDQEREIERLQDEKAILEMEAVGYKQEIEMLEAECEKERMRLAACGVAALGYFDGKCHDDYKSASLDDVMSLRKRADLVDKKLKIAVAVLKNFLNPPKGFSALVSAKEALIKLAALDSQFANSERDATKCDDGSRLDGN